MNDGWECVGGYVNGSRCALNDDYCVGAGCVLCRRQWETIEQYAVRTGVEWSDNAAVYAWLPSSEQWTVVLCRVAKLWQKHHQENSELNSRPVLVVCANNDNGAPPFEWSPTD